MKRRDAVRRLSFSVVVSLVAACTPKGSLEASCEGTVDTILKLSRVDQMERFDRINLDEKYQWLICGNQFVHPPMIELTSAFAELGPTAVAYLKPNLETAEGDLTIRDVVLVFSSMQALGTYDVASDAELMKLLDDNVARMSDPGWKGWALDELERIRAAKEIQ